MRSRHLAVALILTIRGADGRAQATITTLSGIEKVHRAAPTEQHNRKCVDRGKASNPALLDSGTNLLKNRIDVGDYRLTTIPTLLKLPFASDSDKTQDMATSRNGWSPAEVKRTGRYESRPVAIQGFVIAIGREGKESSNCQIADTSWFDYHMWVVRTEAEANARDKRKAVVAEITPRVRHGHADDFDIKQIQTWAHDGTKVIVSGWLMLDPDHPDDSRTDASGNAASRGTIWEIHPVMKIAPVKP